MRWNLRMVAAQRGVWKASDLRRALGEAGMEISAGKMSHLWSSTPLTVRLEDLDVICHVLECEPGELLVVEPPAAAVPAPPQQQQAAGSTSVRPSPSRNSRRTLPPA